MKCCEKNKTLIEAARTMLADSFLPNTFWAEAVSTACYVLNRVLVTKPHNKTPYELLTGKTTNIRLQIQEKEANEEAEALRTNLEQELKLGCPPHPLSKETAKMNEGACDFSNLETMCKFEIQKFWSENCAGWKKLSVQSGLYGNKKDEKEEVDVSSTTSFQDPKSHQKVYKVVKALYGRSSCSKSLYRPDSYLAIAQKQTIVPILYNKAEIGSLASCCEASGEEVQQLESDEAWLRKAENGKLKKKKQDC
ncbi:ribonuclease H-like domain-containing protein [Tanacetum coccineum]